MNRMQVTATSPKSAVPGAPMPTSSTDVIETTVRDDLPEGYSRWRLKNTCGFKTTVVVDARVIAFGQFGDHLIGHEVHKTNEEMA